MVKTELTQWLEQLDGNGLEVTNWDQIERELAELPEEVVVGTRG